MKPQDNQEIMIRRALRFGRQALGRSASAPVAQTNATPRSVCRLSGMAMALAIVLLSSPLFADIFEGTVFRDDDADGWQTEGEAGIEGVRIMAHTEDGRILAQAESGENGRFRLSADGETGTAIQVIAVGLGGRFASRMSPAAPTTLSGTSEVQVLDVALVDPARLRPERFPAARVGGAPLAEANQDPSKSLPTTLAKLDFPGGLDFPNVGPYVTMRCAGSNNVFDFDEPMLDRIATAAPQSPDAEPYHTFGAPYQFTMLPTVGERCRIFAPTEFGAVPPED